MANQLIFPRALDANGYIASGAKATVYLTGTATLATIYSDLDGTIAAANPVIADADGIFPQRYANVAVKVAYTTAADETLYTQDPAPAIPATGAGASQISYDPIPEVPVTNVQAAIDYLATEFEATIRDPENRIINGAFDFWQRGTSGTASGYVAADRWINSVAGGTVTQSRQAFAVGDALGGNNPRFFLRQSVTGQSLAAHLASTTQRIEGVRSYAAQTITVLGWARRSSGAGNLVIEGVQNFGTGGSPSAVVSAINPTTITLTTSWQPFAAVFALPSIAGKTLGINGDDYLALSFWTSAGSDFNARTNSLGIQTITVDLWGVHVKVGTYAASTTSIYRQPEVGPELARCQRYYRPLVVNYAGEVRSASAYISIEPLSPQMREVPTCVSAANVSAPVNFAATATTDYSASLSASNSAAFSRSATATNVGSFHSFYGMDAEL